MVSDIRRPNLNPQSPRMTFEDALDEALSQANAPALPEATRKRIGKLAAASPLYAAQLLANPGWAQLLQAHEEDVAPLTRRRHALLWNGADPGIDAPRETWLRALQRYRRIHCMCIAYREVNGLAPVAQSVAELSALAEHCLHAVFNRVFTLFTQRFGRPHSAETGHPSQWCILGMGKLGGSELNFCSDLDLIFFHDDPGMCMREDGREGTLSNAEFYARMVREGTQLLQERTECGFLYNIDWRLRPEGDTGPMVRTLAGMEHYYYTAGQTWERLAMIKARPVAGDATLGGEFLESINTFRYPRHPQPAILTEVAGVKVRIEREVIGAGAMRLNIKNGYGGIREVEFFVQGLQILHGGRNPFLQATGTMEALERLIRYELATKEQAEILREAYAFFRLLENRVQMREETQEHALPAPGPAREAFIAGLDLRPAEFEERLDGLRDAVHAIYKDLVGEPPEEDDIDDIRALLSGADPGTRLMAKLERWFGDKAGVAGGTLRNFVTGGPDYLLTREHCMLFRDMAAQFDDLLPPLAHPRRTLERLERYAQAYGARMQLLKVCAANKEFFRAILLLFDRSAFIHEWVCRQPEILEEVLFQQLRRNKDVAQLREEMAQAPSGGPPSRWLRLYVKAEQVRLAARQLLAKRPQCETELELSMLADAVLAESLGRIDGNETGLALIGLGKLGAQELAFGSDLDLIAIGTPRDIEQQGIAIRNLRTALGPGDGDVGSIYELDFRLRPHGNDGPLVVTLEAFADYGTRHAQLWERMMLLRARFVAGNAQLGEQFLSAAHTLALASPISDADIAELWQLRLRAEREKTRLSPKELCFKAGPGGIMDIEYLVQLLQLRHGRGRTSVITPNTRRGLKALADAGVLAPDDSTTLAAHYEHLRLVEFSLRREVNASISNLPSDAYDQQSIARWFGHREWPAFWDSHLTIMQDTRARVTRILCVP